MVFLCGLGRRINYGDLQKPVLFHPRLGLGPKGLDRETMVEFTTLARTGVALALKKELLAEEMRLLYVAMTRAKEKLILTHALAYGRGRPEEPGGECLLPRRPPGAGGVHQCGSVAPAHCAGPAGGGELRAAIGREELPAGGSPGAILAHCLPWRRVSQRGSSRRGPCKAARHAALPPEELLAQLRWRYPYEASAPPPAKVTATQVADQDPGGGRLVSSPGPGIEGAGPVLPPAICPGLSGAHPGPERDGGPHGDAEHPSGQNRVCGAGPGGAGPLDRGPLPHRSPGPGGGPSRSGPVLRRGPGQAAAGEPEPAPGVSVLGPDRGPSLLSPGAGGGGGPAPRGDRLLV